MRVSLKVIYKREDSKEQELVFKQGVINLFKAKKHDFVVSLDECKGGETILKSGEFGEDVGMGRRGIGGEGVECVSGD
jgi:hypothetical protein